VHPNGSPASHPETAMKTSNSPEGRFAKTRRRVLPGPADSPAQFESATVAAYRGLLPAALRVRSRSMEEAHESLKLAIWMPHSSSRFSITSKRIGTTPFGAATRGWLPSDRSCGLRPGRIRSARHDSTCLAIPMKRCIRPLVGFLSREEVQAIINRSRPTTWRDKRDRVSLVHALQHSEPASVRRHVASRSPM